MHQRIWLRTSQAWAQPTKCPAHGCTQMLDGLREAYERHHKCVYEPAALDAAVQLSARYIADRQLPDKVSSVPTAPRPSPCGNPVCRCRTASCLTR